MRRFRRIGVALGRATLICAPHVTLAAERVEHALRVRKAIMRTRPSR
jgi:hypothetical protein